jgi:hypothetical protein
MHILTISRKTTARPEAIWELWANVEARTRWDDSLEIARLDGPFQLGARGTVKLKGQPQRSFEIRECVPWQKYTDRFFLPLGGKMDWVHSITEVEGGRVVTFEVSAFGPTSLILGPIMKSILQRELPPTVEKLVTLAEQAVIR